MSLNYSFVWKLTDRPWRPPGHGSWTGPGSVLDGSSGQDGSRTGPASFHLCVPAGSGVLPAGGAEGPGEPEEGPGEEDQDAGVLPETGEVTHTLTLSLCFDVTF